MALKLRATRSPAQEWWTNVLCPPGHNTPLPLERSPPVSFKRLLDGALRPDARARRAPPGGRARPTLGSCFWAPPGRGRCAARQADSAAVGWWGAASCCSLAPGLRFGDCLCAAPLSTHDARRGTPVARPWGVGRGEPRLVREHPSSAPRAITVPNEFTKECLWSGSAPPNGSRLSCGASAGGR